jgi:ATP-dependent DNA helicase RecQ
MVAAGLECSWSTAAVDVAKTKLPPGLFLLAPENTSYDSLNDTLIRKLAGAGFEQFLVPGHFAYDVARIVVDCPVKYGFVLPFDEWAGTPPTSLPQVPTAVLLPHDANTSSQVLGGLRLFSVSAPKIPVAVVARPERTIGDRRLDQTVAHAPYHEQFLDDYTLERRAS